MEGPRPAPGMEGLFNDDQQECPKEVGADKANVFLFWYHNTTVPCTQPSLALSALPLQQEKELNQFITSILSKTSKLHGLIGELEAKFDDARATKRPC